MKKTITIELSETLAQMLIIALRDAEDKHLGTINFGKLLPDVQQRQVFLQEYHEYNGDPEEYDPDDIQYFNPNWSIGMIWSKIRGALETEHIGILADSFDAYHWD